jgi:hypothetical protein
VFNSSSQECNVIESRLSNLQLFQTEANTQTLLF